MASVTVALTQYVDFTAVILWNDNVSLGSTFDDGGVDQTLTSLNLTSATGQIEIYIDGTNMRFTAAFEATGRIIITASDGEALEITIGGASMEEAYVWTPTNNTEVSAFIAHVQGLADHDAMLTLTDDPPPLTLAALDTTGLDVEAAALLEAADDGTSGGTLYADSTNGGSSVPLDGELGLGPDNTVISLMRRQSASQLRLNDRDNPESFNIRAYFDGDGNDLTVHLQTLADGVVTFAVAGAVAGGNATVVRFNLPTAAQNTAGQHRYRRPLYHGVH